MEFNNFPPSTTDRWGNMRQRLRPLLGDVASHFGPAWYRSLEELFTAEDQDVAAIACRGPFTRSKWHLIRYTAAGQALDECGEGIACARSLAEAIASLLEMCEKHRLMPTAAVYDKAGSSLKLYVREKLLASIEPVVCRPVNETLRKRALGTIVRLRKAQDAADELLKRIQRWPGLSAVRHPNGLRKPVVPVAESRHLPIPSEWRMSAKLLCTACGRPDADARLVDEVTAAALNALSWNHLARHGDRSSALLQPWVMSYGDGISSGRQVFYEDGIDAIADTLACLPKDYAAKWMAITLEYGRAFLSEMPVFRFRGQAPAGTTLEQLLQGIESPTDVAVYPTPLVDDPQPVNTNRAEQALAGDSVEVAQLFGTALPWHAKAEMLDDLAGQVLIVQDAGWRFTRTGDPCDIETTIWAFRLDECGNCAERVAVPAYKGLLRSHRAAGLHVLSADYDGRNTVAAISGLSPAAVAQIRACLPDTCQQTLEFTQEHLSERDRKALQELMDAVLP